MKNVMKSNQEVPSPGKQLEKYVNLSFWFIGFVCTEQFDELLIFQSFNVILFAGWLTSTFSTSLSLGKPLTLHFIIVAHLVSFGNFWSLWLFVPLDINLMAIIVFIRNMKVDETGTRIVLIGKHQLVNITSLYGWLQIWLCYVASTVCTVVFALWCEWPYTCFYIPRALICVLV